jgi:predicted RNase H-like HicB family nuclease
MVAKDFRGGATLGSGRSTVEVGRRDMKTYSFKVVVEPDDDRWRSYCPALEQYAASTWGNTEEEAFKHIHEVVGMIIRELTEDGIALPESPREDVEVLPDTRVAVTV